MRQAVAIAATLLLASPRAAATTTRRPDTARTAPTEPAATTGDRPAARSQPTEPADDRRHRPATDGTVGTAARRAFRLGILAECEGAFGGFNEDVVAGATLALVERRRCDPELDDHRARRLRAAPTSPVRDHRARRRRLR